MAEKWLTLSSRTLLKDRWINLRADDCRTQDGHEIAPYYVLTYPEWVHVVALTPRDEVVLVRQYRHAAGDCFLELPGGVVDDTDQGPERSAARELEEETGFTAPEFRLVSSLYSNPAIQTNRVHVYLALGAECTGRQKLEPGEAGLAVHLMPVDEVLSRLHAGILGHSLHVSGLLLALSASGYLPLRARAPF